MFIDVIDKLEDFESLRSNWDAVYEADPEAQFFLSWTWLSQWLSAVEHRWFILAAKPSPNAPYVAFFPLRLRTKLKHGSGFYNEIGMVNSGVDYTGLICPPDSQYKAIPALARFLKTLNWTRIRLENIRISDERLRLLLAHFPPRAFNLAKAERINAADNVNNCICPQVNLPGDWDSYLNSLSANTRQKIRRFLRMVESDRAYRITHARSDTVERDVGTLLEFWGARWGSRKGDRLSVMLQSNRTMLLRCFRNGSLLLPVLWCEETPLGALAILVDRQKASFLFFIGGRDDTVQSPPPGLVLHAYSIRHAIAGGFRIYDFLRGNEAYKYSFGARERRIHCLAVGTRTGRNLGETLDRRSVPTVLQHATELHRVGNLAEAERGYRQILAVEPAHQAALHGLDRMRAGESDRSAPARVFEDHGRAPLS
jgi:CelD/BcsL family acetyltransferase involved in cellulose biosynthesis